MFNLDSFNKIRDKAINDINNKELCRKLQIVYNKDSTYFFEKLSKDSLLTSIFDFKNCSKKDTFPNSNISINGVSLRSVGIDMI